MAFVIHSSFSTVPFNCIQYLSVAQILYTNYSQLVSLLLNEIILLKILQGLLVTKRLTKIFPFTQSTIRDMKIRNNYCGVMTVFNWHFHNVWWNIYNLPNVVTCSNIKCTKKTAYLVYKLLLLKFGSLHATAS